MTGVKPGVSGDGRGGFLCFADNVSSGMVLALFVLSDHFHILKQA
jgi:hypothetical protein